MRILCDVDGVILDHHSEWLRRYNHAFSDTLTTSDVRGWGIHQYVKPECGSAIYAFLQAPDLYENMPMMPGADQGVRRLRELGHDVVFVTSCHFGMVDQKARRLSALGITAQIDNGVGRLPEDLVVVSTGRKHLYLQGDLLIEDHGDTVRDWVATTQKPAILLNAAYNQDLDVPSFFWSFCKRTSSWDEIVLAVENFA